MRIILVLFPTSFKYSDGLNIEITSLSFNCSYTLFKAIASKEPIFIQI